MGGSSKKVTVGYKYYLGMHMVLCHGPVDYVERIRVDKRDAWLGRSKDQQIFINKPGLFGGEDREGGVIGKVDIEGGSSTQLQNDYLQDRLGPDIPAFRGVVSAVLRQVYLGLNPYIKPWSFRTSRVHVRGDGITQWYDEKAEPPSLASLPAKLEYNDFSVGWETNAPDKFQLIDGQIANTLVNASNSDYWRIEAPSFTITELYCEFTIVVKDQGDPLGIRFDSDTGADLFGFMPQAEVEIDSLKRPHVNYWTGPIPIYDQELDQGVLYSFEARLDLDAGNYTYYLRQGQTLLATGTSPLPPGTPQYVTFGRTSNASPEESGIAAYSKLVVGGFSSSGDMNPSHIIRECLTDTTWGMGYLDVDVDETSFIQSADTLYDENMGMSLLWDRQMPIEEFINEVVRHIDASLYVDRVTGKFTLKLIRNDYEVNTLITLGPDNIQKVSDYGRIDPGNSVNSITVIYWDSLSSEESSVSADDPALIQAYGNVVNTAIQYPGFTNPSIAGRAALRDLQALSFPLLSAVIEADRSASELNIGDVFKFEWPESHTGYVVMRVNQIQFGDGRKNRIKINASEDVFSLPDNSTTTREESGWVDPSGEAIESNIKVAEEAPYYELVQALGQTTIDNQLSTTPEIGYLLLAADRPEGGITAQVWVDDGSGYEESGVLDFAPSCLILDELPRSIEGILVESITFHEARDMDLISLGSHGQIGEELIRINSLDLATGVMQIERGVLDTVPQDHLANTPIIFWDEYSAAVNSEYVNGETLRAKVLTNSSQGTLPLGSASSIDVVMSQRAFKPYPPGDVKYSSGYFPETIGGGSELSLTWNHRDRLQQTADEIYGFTYGDVGPELNTEYQVDLYMEDGSFIKTVSGISGKSFSYPILEEKADCELQAGVNTGEYPDRILTLSPTAYWSLDELSGTVMGDRMGLYPGTYHNSPNLGQAPLIRVGTSVGMDGSIDYATVPDNAALRPGVQEYAVEMWASFTGTGLGMAFGKFSTVSPFTGITVFFNYRDDLTTAGYIELRDKRDANFRVDTITSGLNDGVARHYVFQRRETSPGVWKLQVYIDGVLDNEITLPSVENLSTTDVIHVGSRPQQHVAGVFDEVSYYVGKSLSGAEIMENYQSQGGFNNNYRQNGKLRAVLRSTRDGYNSLFEHDHTIKRVGYGFNYGEYYGGA